MTFESGGRLKQVVCYRWLTPKNADAHKAVDSVHHPGRRKGVTCHMNDLDTSLLSYNVCRCRASNGAMKGRFLYKI